MFYERSQEITERVDKALKLIQTGNYSTQSLATALGVSVPTASRVICALRHRGYAIKAVKNGKGWVYCIQPAPSRTSKRQEARHA